jgi:hypothetical protein
VSYLAVRKSKCTWIEYTQSSTQTISSNDAILWDVERSTSTPAMSINSSTGVITLDSSKRYWIQASMHVTRSSETGFEFQFQTGAGAAVTPADGGFQIYYTEDASDPVTNSSFVASLMVSYPTTTYVLRCTSIALNSTLESQSHLFVMEME